MIALLCALSWAQEVVWEDTLSSGINDVVVSDDLSSVAFIGSDMSYLLSTLSGIFRLFRLWNSVDVGWCFYWFSASYRL